MTGRPEARWRADPYPYERAIALASELGLSHTTAAVLVRRGFADGEAARSFLEGGEQHDPGLFAGIGDAVATVMRHVAAGTPIAVHGDYDVDGVCSAAVLASTLEALGARTHVRLPSRDEGYGLSVARVEELHAAGARLLITTDCGITACAEVARARELGMDMVVTDHHRPGEELPACPVVHPEVCGYPAELCATGVAFKFAQALYGAAERDVAELERELDLVALATVADLVPLVGENRALVKQGLRAIAGTSRPGLRALLRVAAVDPQSVTEQTLGFALAPRINAAGRLYRADAALELVLTPDEDRALQIARELDAINTERQSVETAILFEAERLLAEQGAGGSGGAADPLYVLAHEEWHPGVIGIVASRLVDRYHRPFVMVAMSQAGDGRGSGRSIRPYDLHAGLAASAAHLEGFGGHRMAAGLQVRAERLDDFRAAIVAHARGCLTPEDLVKVEHVDAVVPGDALGLDLAEELQTLRPFGMGNPAINVLVPAAKVSDVRPMGPAAATCASASRPAACARARSASASLRAAARSATATARRATTWPPGWRRTSGRERWSRDSSCARCTRSQMHRSAMVPAAARPATAGWTTPNGGTRSGLPTKRPIPYACQLPTANRELSWITAPQAPSACSAT